MTGNYVHSGTFSYQMGPVGSTGTISQTLALNAGAVILAHNHPSGLAEPSRADEFLTQTMKSALALVDVRVLDHLVIGRGQVVSMAERGLVFRRRSDGRLPEASCAVWLGASRRGSGSKTCG